ncbi:MAG: NAD-dependent DNA ligase LigA [Parasporobacterium sp.]|nr:NAD-dependent DNA ligase LigA [Parasporobacterium sp.]
MNSEKTARIKELTELLNKASRAYYAEGTEIMSNYEYDALYDELVSLEEETGFILSNSPTQNVGYEAAQQLVKEAHETPALSLDKTKDPQVLADFLGVQKGILSWKLDGLTVVVTYENGNLLKAVTRGNGEIGEVVTANARTFANLPLTIPYKGKLVLRGEAVIRYSDFERINREIPDADAKYKNPRNLCSGSVRQLDPAVTASRSVNYLVFSLVTVSGDADVQPDFCNSNEKKFLWLKGLGFDVVPYRMTDHDSVQQDVRTYAEEIQSFDIPSDGLVLLLDDIAYGESLGRTAKFPRNAIAFKWMDETAQTTLTEIEWSPSRTGLINPVAIFDPVELEGTTVSRASLHNLSIMEGLKLGIGDTITVYKANMIIPQIAENLTESGNFPIPDTCPACHGATCVVEENDVKTLHCPNPECPAKKIKLFADFVSRNAMNIEGISEETLEKFIGHGFITEFADIYRLSRYRDEIVNMNGFGEKSYENLIRSVNQSRKTALYRLINGLGIIGIGPQNAKVLCRHFKNDFEKLRCAGVEELTGADGIGEVLAGNIRSYFADEENKRMLDDLLQEITLEQEQAEESDLKLTGMTFVITGSLTHYENRDALKSEIEAMGGKVAGSVSAKTSYLINNDILSGSSKNKKARELNIPVITEEEYLEMIRELM